MKHQNPQTLHAWITAEQADQPDDADRLFRDVMAELPRLAPRRGFAARVLTSAGVLAPRPASGIWVAWWMYALVGTALTLSAVAVASVSGLNLLGAVVGSIHAVAVAASRLWWWVGTWASAGWSIWQLLAQIGGALAAVVSQPAAGAFVAINLAVASLALLVLRRLLVLQEG
jgi:hypothetical protein